MDMSLRLLITAKNTASSVISGVVSSLASIDPVLGAVAGIAGGVGLAVGLIGTVSTQMAADYQQSMLKVQALTGMTQQQAQQMSDAILQMAPQLGQAPKDLAEGLYFVASAGFQGADALKVLQYSGEAAATGHFSAKVAADALTSALNAFGLSGAQAGNIMDELTATVTAGKMEWGDYAKVVGRLGSITAQTKQPFQDTNAALAVFTNGGTTARQAATYLNNTLIQLELKTDSLAKNAKKLGISFDEQKFKSMDLYQQVQYLNQITGGNNSELLKLMNNNSTAAKTVMYLRDHYKQFGNTIQTITQHMKNGQTTQDAFATTQQGLNQQLKDAKAAFDALLIKIGLQLLPVVTGLVKQLIPVIVGFTQWIEKSGIIQQILGVVGGAVKLLGQVFAFLWPYILQAVKAVEQFIAQLETRLRPIVAAIVSWLKQHWGDFVAFFKALWDTLRKVIKLAWDFITGLIKIALDIISGNWKQAWQDISDFFTNIWNDLLDLLGSIWTDIQDAFQIGLDFLSGLWDAFWNSFSNFLSSVWNNFIVQPLTSLWNNISSFFSSAWSNYIVKPLESLWNNVSNFFSSAWSNYIVKPLEGLWNNISSFFGSAWSNYVAKPVADFWNNLSTVFSSAWTNYVSKPLQGLWSNIENGFVNLAHKAADWGKQLIENFINAIKNAIPAGTPGIQFGINVIAPALAGHAAGGSNLPGGWSVVGEQGPELLYNPQGSSILPAGVTRSVLSGSGGHTFNINVSGGSGSPDDIASAIRQQIANLMRSYANLPNITSGGRL